MPSETRGESGGLRRLAPPAIALLAIATAIVLAANLPGANAGPETTLPHDQTLTCGTGADSLTVSHPSGFHDRAFPLTVSATKDTTVYYTTDGTRPDPIDTDRTSTYIRPIPIQDQSWESGPLSTMRTSVYVAPWDVDSATWQLAGPNTDRGMAVRLRTETGVECTFVYFIGSHLRRDLPVVHLTLNPDFLFDHDTGIYVLGAHFQANRDSFKPEESWKTEGNYSLRGDDWERPFATDPSDAVIMHYFTADGALTYSSNLGIRIHGGVSRAFPQKSLRLYARTEYGNRTFEYPFFGEDGPQVHRRLVLRGAGSHCMCLPDYGGVPNSHLSDGYLQSLVRHLSFDSQGMQPVVVFINGEYWGVHHIRDRQDEHWIEIAYGVEADQVAVVEAPAPGPSDIDSDWEPIFELLEYLDQTHPSDRSAMTRLEAEMDLESFLDWLSVQIFVANKDMANNYRLWRVRAEPSGGPSHPGDGRWRWFLYDLDMYDFDRTGETRFDMFQDMAEPDRSEIPSRFYRWLIQDEDFVKMLVNRVADHLNTVFLPERSVPMLDDLEARLATEMVEHINRWAAALGLTTESWHRGVDHLREYMINRPDYVWDQILHNFDLPGTVPVLVESGEGGAVRINSLVVDGGTQGTTDPWSGRYFSGVLIRLTAIPAPGFRFDGWEGLPQNLADEPAISIDPADVARITARFVRG